MDFRREPERLMPILGKSFIDQLTAHGDNAVLRIGKDTWSKHEIATRLGIVHTVACGTLSRFCKKLGVTSTRDLFNRTTPYSLTETKDKIGVTTLYVMFAAFRDKGLDARDWYRLGEKQAIVTFDSLKEREAKAEHRTKTDERERRRRIGAVQHQRNVHNFINHKRASA